MRRIDSLVLDKDLFLREAKILVENGYDQAQRQQFYEVLAKAFEDGQPHEIIDGDIDEIAHVSLFAIMTWI